MSEPRRGNGWLKRIERIPVSVRVLFDAVTRRLAAMSRLGGHEKRFKRIQGATLWVGALCGIIVAVLTIREKITDPTSPDLHATFARTGKPSLEFVRPPGKSPKTFPLDLVVRNDGCLTARDVRLKLFDSWIGQAYLIIQTNTEEFTQNSLYVSESMKRMTTVPVGTIHPGESVCLESTLLASFGVKRPNQPPILTGDGRPSVALASYSPRGREVEPIRHHRITAWIAAENFPEREMPLHVIVYPPGTPTAPDGVRFRLLDNGLLW